MLNLNELIECTKCKKPKEKKEFRARSNRKIGRSSWCKSCLNQWRVDNKKVDQDKWTDRQFAYDLKRNYGITVEDFNRMFEEQKGQCACCGTSHVGFKRRLHVDHDHLSNQVRGLLCTKCNPGLGYFMDSIEKLEMAILYLKKFKK
jgi:hypothetical protein